MVSQAPEFTKHTHVSDSGDEVKSTGARTRQATHRQMSEIAPEDARDVMCRVILLFPVE